MHSLTEQKLTHQDLAVAGEADDRGVIPAQLLAIQRPHSATSYTHLEFPNDSAIFLGYGSAGRQNKKEIQVIVVFHLFTVFFLLFT